MTGTTPDITPLDLARALDRVARILQARVDADGLFPDGNGTAHFDRRICLQVAAGLPATARFDRDAFVTAWRSLQAGEHGPHRKALYRRLREVLIDELTDDYGRWEGPREPAAIRRLAARVRRVDTKVTIDGVVGPLDAKVDPTHRWNGWVVPHFTLDAVRELAAQTQRLAEECCADSTETVHVLDVGGTDRDGNPMVVVCKVAWQYFEEESAERSTDIIEPDEDGLYCVGGGEWTWYLASWWCLCSTGHDWHVPHCEDCGMAREQSEALKEATPGIGRILRRLAPETTAVLFEADGVPRIVGAVAGENELNLGDGGPFDTETLGEADAALHAALGSGLTDSGPHWLRFS
jgi:hypothetical protein